MKLASIFFAANATYFVIHNKDSKKTGPARKAAAPVFYYETISYYQLMKSNSRYLGSGHCSLSMTSSSLSTCSLISSSMGATVSW